MLYEKAREAPAKADRTHDAGDEACAAALESALDAAARELLNELAPDPDLSGIRSPPVEDIKIPPGEAAGN